MKNDEWFQHEAMDRTHMILAMLQEALGYYDPDSDQSVHPGLWNNECKWLLLDITGKLSELYLKIGEWEEPKLEKLDTQE